MATGDGHVLVHYSVQQLLQTSFLGDVSGTAWSILFFQSTAFLFGTFKNPIRYAFHPGLQWNSLARFIKKYCTDPDKTAYFVFTLLLKLLIFYLQAETDSLLELPHLDTCQGVWPVTLKSC